jgi:hypothetical protein
VLIIKGQALDAQLNAPPHQCRYVRDELVECASSRVCSPRAPRPQLETWYEDDCKVLGRLGPPRAVVVDGARAAGASGVCVVVEDGWQLFDELYEASECEDGVEDDEESELKWK